MLPRYKVIPRSLIFLFNGDDVLLIRHNSPDKVGYGKWNGIGGHIENGEDPYYAAIREISEETGLLISKLNLEIITIIPETEEFGICLFIFSGFSARRKVIESSEGELKWVSLKVLRQFHLMEDLEYFLDLIAKNKKIKKPMLLASNRNKNGVHFTKIV